MDIKFNNSSSGQPIGASVYYIYECDRCGTHLWVNYIESKNKKEIVCHCCDRILQIVSFDIETGKRGHENEKEKQKALKMLKSLRYDDSQVMDLVRDATGKDSATIVKQVLQQL